MARIETSTNLVGKVITLMDGTKTKIEDAIASGYKVKGQTKRIATRCVVKKGSGYAEIEKLPMTQLIDTGEGYVELKSATAKAPAKAAAKTTAKAPTSKSAEPRTRKSKAEQSKEFDKLAKGIIGGKTTRKTKAEAPAEPRTRVRRKKSAAEPVTLTEVNEGFTAALAERLFDHLKDNDLLKFDADNVTPITNAVDVKYSAEFAAPNMIHVTFGFEYAMPEAEPEGAESALDDAVIARAAKKVGTTVGKKLALAIKKAYGIPASEFLPGTVLSLSGAEFVYCGPSKDDADTAYLYSAETDKFRPVTSANLVKYEMVAEEVEEEDDEEEDEDVDFDDGDDEEEGEEEEEESSDDTEYTYHSITKAHLADVSKSVTAKYHDRMAEMWGVDADVLVPGLVLTDGETTFAYVGFNNKGGLLVVDIEDNDLMVYKKADVATLTDFAAVIGDDEEAEDADDAEFEEGDDEEEEEEEESEEEEEEEEEGEDDFDFDDTDTEDFDDLSHDELIDKVVELGLSTPRKAANMKEAKLRELLADA